MLSSDKENVWFLSLLLLLLLMVRLGCSEYLLVCVIVLRVLQGSFYLSLPLAVCSLFSKSHFFIISSISGSCRLSNKCDDDNDDNENGNDNNILKCRTSKGIKHTLTLTINTQIHAYNVRTYIHTYNINCYMRDDAMWCYATNIHEANSYHKQNFLCYFDDFHPNIGIKTKSI